MLFLTAVLSRAAQSVSTELPPSLPPPSAAFGKAPRYITRTIVPYIHASLPGYRAKIIAPNKEIGDKSFERLLRINENYICDEVKRKLNFGNGSFHSVRNL
jgi:hypothetical protein